MTPYANEVSYQDRCQPTPAPGVLRAIANKDGMPIYLCVNAGTVDVALDPNQRLIWRGEFNPFTAGVLDALDAARSTSDLVPDEFIDLRFDLLESMNALIFKETDELTGRLSPDGRLLIEAILKEVRAATILLGGVLLDGGTVPAANDPAMVGT